MDIPESIAHQLVELESSLTHKIKVDSDRDIEQKSIQVIRMQESQDAKKEWISHPKPLKKFNLYRSENVYFENLNLNNPKFRNLIKEIIDGEYIEAESFFNQIYRYMQHIIHMKKLRICGNHITSRNPI